MTEDQRRIQQLEEELQKILSQISRYRQQLHELKVKSETHTPEEKEKEEYIPPQKNKDWEFPSHTKENSSGLEHFIGLKLLHLAGIVVLVIGISIGVKYAVDKDLISPAMRIMAAAAAGILLYIFSMRLKKRFELFSAVLFSGAMASLYFTTYAAFTYYQLIPFAAAFVLMAVITGFTILNAIRYNKQQIAILGMLGAYAIPFLISANADRVDLFFGYIIFINAGIIFLYSKKGWLAVVQLAMAVSWILFTGWAISRYEPAMQTMGATVLFILYGLFTGASVGIAAARKQPLAFQELLLFLLNTIFAFTASLLIFTKGGFGSSIPLVTGIAAVVFAVQSAIVKLLLPKEELLFNCLVSFSLLCLIMYILLRWDGVRVTISWLAIAAILFTGGVITKTGWLRLMAIVLTGITLLKLVLIDGRRFSTEEKIISYLSTGVLMLLLSFFYQRHREKFSADKK